MRVRQSWSRVLLIASLISTSATMMAQSVDLPDGDVYVDNDGIMRWEQTGDEVALFGINYSTPFAHAYRAVAALGVDHKTAIDRDVLHFSRLGTDAFRIHVWEREITDSLGNLIENEHLDLLDYLLSELKDAGIKIALTPIAWWGTGYPEPDPKTGGFSEAFSKEEMTHDPAALEAITTYLPRFIEHVNPYTGLSYGHDPDILFIELFNEPWHTEPYPERTAFINTLVESVRATGFDKPIFYNMNERYDEDHGRAICSADIQGVGGQWYPTGLVSDRTIEADMLPNVNRYAIPWAATPECADKARMIYEFDAADVAGSYMYPAMARSFRAAGFQFATMFSYDPLAIAPFNTEYPTHYVNLVYTPSKAVSLMIAGEVFRRQPVGVENPDYPANNTFGPFRVSYEEDLSEMVTDREFLYSSTTETQPPRPDLLERIAGVGNSPIVKYEGTGAYFLDRISPGSWRLEVYPDAVQVAEPFATPSLDRDVTRVYHVDRWMEVDLPDLGDTFGFAVRPGTYRLENGTAEEETDVEAAYYAPSESNEPSVVTHSPPAFVNMESPFFVSSTVASTEPPDSVSLFIRRNGWGGFSRFHMQRTGPFSYETAIQGDLLQPGRIEYAFTLHENDKATTFPGGFDGHPRQWDFTGTQFWSTRVVNSDNAVILFDAGRDADELLWPNWGNYVRFQSAYVSGSTPDRDALEITVPDFSPRPHEFAIRAFLPPEDREILSSVGMLGRLVVTVRSTTDSVATLEVALTGRDGAVFGALIEAGPDWNDIVIPVDSLRPVRLALLPRPYPSFLPYDLDVSEESTLDVSDVGGIQIRLLSPNGAGASGFQLEKVAILPRYP